MLSPECIGMGVIIGCQAMHHFWVQTKLTDIEQKFVVQDARIKELERQEQRRTQSEYCKRGVHKWEMYTPGRYDFGGSREPYIRCSHCTERQVPIPPQPLNRGHSI